MTLPEINLYVLFLQFVSDDRLLLKMAVKTTIKRHLNTLLKMQKIRDKKMFIFFRHNYQQQQNIHKNKL